jgi:hypothetical protein
VLSYHGINRRIESNDHLAMMTRSTNKVTLKLEQGKTTKSSIADVSYAAPQAHKIVNIALHWEYSLGIVFIFS